MLVSRDTWQHVFWWCLFLKISFLFKDELDHIHQTLEDELQQQHESTRLAGETMSQVTHLHIFVF